jgi:hypothetical protein
VSAKEFYFALTIPAASVSSALLEDLLSRVCAVCAAPETVPELMREIEPAVGQLAGHGDCELRFQAHGGALDIAVRSGARQVWQSSRPID